MPNLTTSQVATLRQVEELRIDARDLALDASFYGNYPTEGGSEAATEAAQECRNQAHELERSVYS